MKKTKDTEEAILVFTSETRQTILDRAGSRGWVVNPQSVKRCRYLVCCRRQDWENRADGIPHRAAFLVGRVSALTMIGDSTNVRGQARFHIGISDFADIVVDDVWRKELRNPVAYSDLRELGIEARRLKFQAVAASRSEGGGERKLGPQPAAAKLTIVEAKRGLAATFGVKPEDIEIIIKG